MKTILLFKRKFYVKASNVFLIKLLFIFIVLVASKGIAQERYPIEYNNFLTEAENIFLFHPNLVKDVFYGLVDLKGNQKSAKIQINRHVLGCQTNIKASRGCRIEKLKLERKNENISGQLVVPVNFTHISATKYNHSKKRVHLQWQPELIHPPAISVKQFLDQVYAAKESKYFQVKKGIERIQLNSILERDIFFIAENKMANSLIGVYKNIPIDKNDTITFEVDYTIPSKRYITMDFSIYFKAVRVYINHQIFKTIERKR